MIITVTSQDFKTTKYGDCINCALATAIKRKFPDAHVIVAYDYAEINGKKHKFDEKTAVMILRSYRLTHPLYLGVKFKTL